MSAAYSTPATSSQSPVATASLSQVAVAAKWRIYRAINRPTPAIMRQGIFNESRPKGRLLFISIKNVL